MSLPYLFKRPEDENDWKAWAFNHAANHFDWLPAIKIKKNVTGLDQFILSPVDPDNLGMWLYNHQIAHDQANAALGTQGFNLIELDWKDPDQFASWLRLNADEHVRISGLLGIG